MLHAHLPTLQGKAEPDLILRLCRPTSGMRGPTSTGCAPPPPVLGCQARSIRNTLPACISVPRALLIIRRHKLDASDWLTQVAHR